MPQNNEVYSSSYVKHHLKRDSTRVNQHPDSYAHSQFEPTLTFIRIDKNLNPCYRMRFFDPKSKHRYGF